VKVDQAMATKNEEFQKRLVAMFRVEAEEHLDLITTGLLDLEKASAVDKQMTIVENIFREAHSLKGAARSVKMTEVEAFCQSMESLFAEWKGGELDPSPELYDTLHKAVDSLRQLLASTDDAHAATLKDQIRQLGEQLADPLPGLSAKQKNPASSGQAYPVVSQSQPFLPTPEAKPMETVRIPTEKLDAVLLQSEELLSVKLATSQHAAELKEINAALVRWKRKWAKVRLEVQTVTRTVAKNGQDAARRHGQFTKITEFLDWNLQSFTELDDHLTAMKRSAEQDRRALGAMVDDLLADMKNVLMLPFSSILEALPRLVRGLSRDQGKEVDLAIEGGEVEIDRRILEEMKDPLIHLIRNCIDHGIERPEEREQKNKPRRGAIKIAISRLDGSKVQLLISDDGRGIDRAKIQTSALKLGLSSQQEAENLNDPETLALVFRSGVSSSPMITNLSGRGLGLAIVREKAEKLRGTVTVQSEVGGGTNFRVVLPLTIATFRGVPVRVGHDLFVLPSVTIERVARVKREKIKTVENKETIELDGKTFSLAHLGDVLELPRKERSEDANNGATVVLISQNGIRIAFLVDEVINEEEVLVKTLGQQLSRVRNIAGATVLANRKLVPILNVSDLMQSAVRVSGTVRAAATASEKEKPRNKSVLVVEDSITTRTLLKGILEAAGYNVNTAVDGVDGLTWLRRSEFDVVVSDVEMPRMNGFDLTAKIRADEKLSELPVILVTALQSREDQERGMDVGANAYIVKSSFDQSDLLEVVGRLA
jgi:two-component system chemotaxis sensor kinase CheA